MRAAEREIWQIICKTRFLFIVLNNCILYTATASYLPIQFFTSSAKTLLFFVCQLLYIKGELGELQIYFRKIPLHQQNFLVVSVLSNSPWLPKNFKKCPK